MTPPDPMDALERVEACRICRSSDLVAEVDLGFTPIAYRLLGPEQLHEPEPYYPLVIARCTDCGLAQLQHDVDPRLLYPPDYPYDMETTQSAIEHFHGLAESAVDATGMTADDLAVDIGSSSGVLLQGYEDVGGDVLGIEPATEMAERARAKGVPTVSEFFDPDLAATVRDDHGPATVITATNVINQIDDLRAFIEGIDALLAEDGLFVFETPHLLHTIEGLHYDHAYHEHSTFLSLRPIERLLAQQDLVVADVEEIPFRGGSLRCYVGRADAYEEAADLQALRQKERDAGLYDSATWRDFRDRVYDHRDQLNHLVYSLKEQGHSIAAVSVTAKGNSLLNVCGLDARDFAFVTEIQDTKIGKYTPGGHIPIVPDERLTEEQPDYALLMAWNFAEEIMDNLSEYEDAGGEFVVPMPEPHVVDR